MPVLLAMQDGDHSSHPTDREIDRLVYELCGLTDEEIRLVEESGKSE